jgi:hypothetical protein
MGDELDALFREVQDALREATQHVVLVRGTDEAARPFWAFVAMRADRWEAFRARTGGGDLADYGTILASGLGEAPPPAEVERMRQEFGYRPVDS